MKESLRAGITATERVDVDESRTIDFMGEALRVYATPEVVRDVEMTCRNLLLENLDDGEDSVGVRVEIDHGGATLMGMWVDIAVTVTAVEGRLVDFEFTATDGVEQVASGRHKRFVVEVAKLEGKLRAKAEAAGL